MIFKKKTKTIRDTAVKALFDIVSDYSEWYDEHGLYLPPDYMHDPTGWCEDLHKVKRAFTLLYEDLNEKGELWEAKKKWEKFGEQDAEKLKDLNNEILDGLRIFGAQLLYLTDPKKGV